jgi:2-oxoglutarate dehydrogenase E1 component
MTLHFPKALDSIIKTVSTLPSDKNLSTRSVKLLLIEKTGYDNNTIDWGTAET